MSPPSKPTNVYAAELSATKHYQNQTSITSEAMNSALRAGKKQMKEKLLRFRKDQKYLIFDYETCNLNLVAGDNKPWQLAFIVAQGDKVLEKQDYWLKWDDLNVRWFWFVRYS